MRDHEERVAYYGKRLRSRRQAERAARDALASAVREATQCGMTESEAARLAGVDRMTIRKWIGK